MIQTFFVDSLRIISCNRFLLVMITTLLTISVFLWLNSNLIYIMLSVCCAYLAILFVNESKYDLKNHDIIWSTQYQLLNYSNWVKESLMYTIPSSNIYAFKVFWLVIKKIIIICINRYYNLYSFVIYARHT